MFCSCCVDYIAAKHIGADAVIHFGSSCLSATYEIPTLYVFPKENLDVQASCDTIKFLATNVPATIVVLYDVAYDHCAGYYSFDYFNKTFRMYFRSITFHMRTILGDNVCF